MTRTSLLLALLVVAVIAGLPLLVLDERGRAYRNFRVVDEGKLYRSGQMSSAGFERVCNEKGIRTVISLREASDDPADKKRMEAEEAYCNRQKPPIVWKAFEPMGWEPDAAGVVPMEANLRAFEDLIDQKDEKGEYTLPRPILIHCFAGIHRTGAHVAVYRMKYDGYTNAEAVAELKGCGKLTTTYDGNLIPFVLRYRPTRKVADADWRP